MLSAYEGHLLACYLANAASGLHHRDREASALAEWVADRENRVARGRRRKRFRQHGMELGSKDGMSAANLRRLSAEMHELLAEISEENRRLDECVGRFDARQDAGFVAAAMARRIPTTTGQRVLPCPSSTTSSWAPAPLAASSRRV